MIDRDGTIYQLVPRSIMCRHTVGLNYTAIGIEHVGFSDGEILRNTRQMAASLRLTRWLRCRYGIGGDNVIGHSENLLLAATTASASRACARRRTATGRAASMRTYRSQLVATRHMLSTLGRCESPRRSHSSLALVGGRRRGRRRRGRA